MEKDSTITVKALRNNVITEEEIVLNRKNAFRTVPFNTISVKRQRITVLGIISNVLGDYWNKFVKTEE